MIYQTANKQDDVNGRHSSTLMGELASAQSRPEHPEPPVGVVLPSRQCWRVFICLFIVYSNIFQLEGPELLLVRSPTLSKEIKWNDLCVPWASRRGALQYKYHMNAVFFYLAWPRPGTTTRTAEHRTARTSLLKTSKQINRRHQDNMLAWHAPANHNYVQSHSEAQILFNPNTVVWCENPSWNISCFVSSSQKTLDQVSV